MYKIMDKNRKVIAITDHLLHCRAQSNGVNVLDDNGPGIIVNDTIYNLPGYESAVVEEFSDDRDVIKDVADEGVASIAFVKMAEAGQIDDVTAVEHSDLFADWHPDISYIVDQMVRYEDSLYRCVQAHTSQADWTPPSVPALWKEVGDPAEEWPEWSQPIGAHDAYGLGDKVSHNGQHWTSVVAANVWEPGVYGWEAEE